MKNNIFISAALLVAIALTSCRRFDEGPAFTQSKVLRLTVCCSSDGTKTELSGEHTAWGADDRIWLTDGNKSVVVSIPASYRGSRTAEIEVYGLCTDSTIVATYPANDDNDIVKGSIVTDIPTVQNGKFGNAHVAVGQCLPGETRIEFKNVTSIIKFSHFTEDIRDMQIRNINASFSGTYSFEPATGDKDKQIVKDRVVRVKMSGTETKYVGVLPSAMARNSRFTFVTIDGRLGSITTSTANSLERNTIYDMGNIDEKIIYYGTATDLGAEETANCYIVPGPGVYRFKAVKGNSFETVDNPAYADIVWETVNTTSTPNCLTVVSEIAYSDGYIYFRVPDGAKDGNALVAIYNELDEIAWSWHLWVLKDGVSDISLTSADASTSGAILMDRNLGALTAIPGKSTTNGFTYQWGRKDPFTGAATLTSGSSTFMAAKGVHLPVSVAQTDDNGTIEVSIAEPYSFIYKSSKDWLISSDASLWSASAKTVFDPCPPGYHVPFGDALDGVAEKMQWDAAKMGRGVEINGQMLWFPAGGNRQSGSGALNNVGTIGYHWFDKNTNADGRNGWKFSSAYTGVDTTAKHGLSCGFAMRCQKTATVGDKQTVEVKFSTYVPNKYIYSPVITSSGYSDAKIFWDPKNVDALESGKWIQYIYPEAGNNTMTITGYSISNIYFKALDGVKSIDISQF